MSDVDKWVAGGVMFVGMYIVICVLRAIYDAFREP